MKKSIIALAILSTMSTAATSTSHAGQFEIDIQVCVDAFNSGQVGAMTHKSGSQLDKELQACETQAFEKEAAALKAKIAADDAERERINNLPPIEAANSARTCSSTEGVGYSTSLITEDNKISYQSFQFPGGEFYSSSQSPEMISNYIDPGKLNYDTRMKFEGVELEFLNAEPGYEYPPFMYVYAEADSETAGVLEEMVTCTSEATYEEGVTKILAEGIINLAKLGDQDISAAALLSNPENQEFNMLEPHQFSVSAPSTPSAFALTIAAERVLGAYPRELTLDEKVILDDTIITKLYEIDPNAEVPTTITATEVESNEETETSNEETETSNEETETSNEAAPADEGGNGSMGLLLMFLPLIRKIIK